MKKKRKKKEFLGIYANVTFYTHYFIGQLFYFFKNILKVKPYNSKSLMFIHFRRSDFNDKQNL